MLDSQGRRLVELTQVLTKCRASGPVCALEMLDIAGAYLTNGDDIINIGSIFPGPQGPPGPPGPPGPGCPSGLEARLAAIESAIRLLEGQLHSLGAQMATTNSGITAPIISSGSTPIVNLPVGSENSGEHNTACGHCGKPIIICCPPGPPGRDGRDGQDGKDGRDGKDGYPGPMGPKGETGAQGRDGRDGKDGRAGAPGPQGKDGRDGYPGAQGETGPMGPQGPKGDTGDRGEQGSQGPIGPQGPAGPQGPVGPKGDPGKDCQGNDCREDGDDNNQGGGNG